MMSMTQNILIWVARADIFICALANVTKWAVCVLLAAAAVYITAIMVYAALILVDGLVRRTMARIERSKKNG